MILVSETNPFITSSSMALSNFNTVSTPSLHHSPTITTRNSETSLQLAPIPETQQPLSVSIVEKTRVTGSNMYVAGQVLITCHSNTGSIPIQLNGLDHIQNLRPRSPYVIVQADGYVINTSHFEPGKPVACFMFDINTDTSQLPLQLVAFWKCVDGISYLIVKHSKNIDIDPSKIKGSVSVAMEDQVNNVQSTPQGVWDTVKNRLTWQISDLMQQYQPDSPQQRLLAKFYIEGKGSSQPIYFNYCLEDNTLPNISIQSDAVEIKQSIVQSNQVVYM
ncbi:hypothetical protein CU098_012063 [Rhizopus stolonifer]|uniref:Muniscin C-terminal domain-containing protein n=1 Tax=Rhizopus stolonifer TaxID=4846 RepID=A0A367KIS5_RHIST|nr:hypothetical protein CU098_012063 [Rhizopus stolonifer]